MTTKTKDIIITASAVGLGLLAVMGLVFGESQKYDGTVWYWISGASVIAWVAIWFVLKGKSERDKNRVS